MLSPFSGLLGPTLPVRIRPQPSGKVAACPLWGRCLHFFLHFSPSLSLFFAVRFIGIIFYLHFNAQFPARFGQSSGLARPKR